MTEDKVPLACCALKVKEMRVPRFGIRACSELFFLGSCKDALWDWNASQERVDGYGYEEECS